MKLIDVVYKIAHNEQVPRLIWYDNNPYRFNGYDYIYDSGDYFDRSLFQDETFTFNHLLEEEVKVEDGTDNVMPLERKEKIVEAINRLINEINKLKEVL